MAKFTKKLGLALPQNGALEWGSAINSNFHIIDTQFQTMDSNIRAVQNSLSSLNFISFDENADYINFVSTGGVVTATFGTVRGNTFTENKDYDRITSNDGSILTKVEKLPQYQGYYIFQKHEALSTVNDGGLFSSNWYPWDILVVAPVTDTGIRSVQCIPFKQSIGGWYKPEIVEDKQIDGKYTVKWTRFIPTDWEDIEFETDFTAPIPYNKTGVLKTTLGETDKWKSTLNTGGVDTWEFSLGAYEAITDATSPPNMVCSFWEENSDSNTYQKVEIDYAFKKGATAEGAYNGWSVVLYLNNGGYTSSKIHCLIDYKIPAEELTPKVEETTGA